MINYKPFIKVYINLFKDFSEFFLIVYSLLSTSDI